MLRSWNLRRTNNLLLAAIILINLYVIIAPFAPAVVFWWEKDHTNRGTQLSQLIKPPKAAVQTTPNHVATAEPNHVVIPSMLLNTPILEGPVSQTYSILNNGVWRWPDGSTPNAGGNTILIGHRFTYTNPRGIFYELNQVNVGDSIGVFWSGKEYLYTVATVSVVSPSDTAVLDQTKQAELTLYTCTPTWNPIHRLIVVASLTSIRSSQTT